MTKHSGNKHHNGEQEAAKEKPAAERGLSSKKDKHRNHPKQSLDKKCNDLLKDDPNGECEFNPVMDCLDAKDPNYNPDDEFVDELPPNESKAANRRRRVSSFGDEPALFDTNDDSPQWSLEMFQTKTKTLLDEYLASGDLKETMRQLAENLPFHQFEDEFVVLAFRKGTDCVKRDNSMAMMETLLITYFHTVEVPKRTSLIRGLEKLLCSWEDYALDVPDVGARIVRLVNKCIKEGLLAANFTTKLPESLLIFLTKEDGPLSKEFESLKELLTELHTFKVAVGKHLSFYFKQEQRMTTLVAQLKELNKPGFHHEFVKKAIVMSIDVSTSPDIIFEFLRDLTNQEAVELECIQWGIIRVLGCLDDLKLDFPKTDEFVHNLLVALVTNDILSAAFLKRCRLLRIGGASGLAVLREVERKLPEYTRKLLGSADFKNELKTTILEYFDSGDKTEVGRIVREFNLTKKMAGEVIRKIMTFAMERSGVECERALNLIEHLVKKEEELTIEDVETGFAQLYEVLPDLSLDVPDAREMTDSFWNQAQDRGLVRENVEAGVAAA